MPLPSTLKLPVNGASKPSLIVVELLDDDPEVRVSEMIPTTNATTTALATTPIQSSFLNSSFALSSLVLARSQQ
jgi:hypothetical protein